MRLTAVLLPNDQHADAWSLSVPRSGVVAGPPHCPDKVDGSSGGSPENRPCHQNSLSNEGDPPALGLGMAAVLSAGYPEGSKNQGEGNQVKDDSQPAETKLSDDARGGRDSCRRGGELKEERPRPPTSRSSEGCSQHSKNGGAEGAEMLGMNATTAAVPTKPESSRNDQGSIPEAAYEDSCDDLRDKPTRGPCTDRSCTPMSDPLFITASAGHPPHHG